VTRVLRRTKATPDLVDARASGRQPFPKPSNWTTCTMSQRSRRDARNISFPCLPVASIEDDLTGAEQSAPVVTSAICLPEIERRLCRAALTHALALARGVADGPVLRLNDVRAFLMSAERCASMFLHDRAEKVSSMMRLISELDVLHRVDPRPGDGQVPLMRMTEGALDRLQNTEAPLIQANAQPGSFGYVSPTVWL
jgi:hypothetical protein